jgi:hypothetical protein
MALVYMLANEEIFRNSRVLKFVGENAQKATRMTAESKNLVTQHARTKLRKASFALSSVAELCHFAYVPVPGPKFLIHGSGSGSGSYPQI